MTWSYDIESGEDKDVVRLLIGDTNTNDQEMSDEEIAYFLTQETDVYLAAARAARALQSKYSRMVDVRVESVSKSYSQRATGYAALAEDLIRQAGTTSIPSPGVSGVSVSEMRSQRSQTDRPREKFYMGKFDSPETTTEDTEGYIE